MAPKTQTSLSSFFGAKGGSPINTKSTAKKLKENADNQTEAPLDPAAGKSDKKHASPTGTTGAKGEESLQRKKRRVIDDDDDDEETEKEIFTPNESAVAVPNASDDPMQVQMEETKASEHVEDTEEDTKMSSSANAGEPTSLTSPVADEEEQADKDDAKPIETDAVEHDSTTRAPSVLLALAPKATVASDAKLLKEIPDTSWAADFKALPYLFLCQSFIAIEETTKRLQIQSILTVLMRQTLLRNPADLYPLIYLASNSVAPAYECVELGIGDSLLIKAIGEATGTNAKMVKLKYETVGDLGLVAMAFKGKQKTLGGFFQSSAAAANKPKPKLSAQEVLTVFREIAKTKGNQAQKWKVDKIKRLLVKATDPLETKYIIRGLQGKLRIGLAQATVLIALAHSLSLTTPATVEEPEKRLKKGTCTTLGVPRRVDVSLFRLLTCRCMLHHPQLTFPRKSNATWTSR